MPDKSKRRKSHGKWFKIQSPEGCVNRILRFSVTLEGSESQDAADIVIDWPAWLELWGYAENVDRSIELTINAVPKWKYPMMVFSHPDPTTKLAGGLALLSVVLGLLSLFFAFES